LLVTSKGGKLWYMKYRYAGKEKKLSFGADRAPQNRLEKFSGSRDGLGSIGIIQGSPPSFSFAMSTISTRRFLVLPASVLLSAKGRNSP